MLYHVDDSNVKTYNGRFYVMILDEEDDNVYEHGVAIAPAGVVSLHEAKALIRAAHNEAMVRYGDEWYYGNVHDILREMGFDVIAIGCWVENRDGAEYPRT